jgi:hypothetical protein
MNLEDHLARVRIMKKKRGRFVYHAEMYEERPRKARHARRRHGPSARALQLQEIPRLTQELGVKRVLGKSGSDCSYDELHSIALNILIYSNEDNSKFRRQLAVYRLFRYFDMQPDEIADLLHAPIGKVKWCIGEAFRQLCIRNDKCVFKNVLAGR